MLGPNHPDVAMTLNNLAVLFKEQGKFNQAEPLFRRALAIFESCLDPDHPKVVTCRENFADMVREQA